MRFKHPFTQLALKFVYDNAARDVWIQTGQLPSSDYTQPEAGSDQDKALRGDSAGAVNEQIDIEHGDTDDTDRGDRDDGEHRDTRISSGLVQTVPHVVVRNRPNWPSRP